MYLTTADLAGLTRPQQQMMDDIVYNIATSVELGAMTLEQALKALQRVTEFIARMTKEIA